MKSKKVCILVTSLYGGGAERVSLQLASHFSATYESDIVTLKDATNDLYVADSAVNKYSLGINKPIGLLSVAWRFRKFLRQNQPDYVIGMMTYNSIIALIATIGLSTKVISTERNNISLSATPKHWRFLRWLLYRKSACVVVQTRASASIIEKFVSAGKIKVIPNAANWPLENYKPLVDVKAFCEDEDRVLLAAGRLAYQKGFDLLIDAFAQCDHTGWKLLIIGEGQLRSSLEAQIQKQGLSEKISLVGRVGNIADWYRRCDLFVLSSRFEGFPNVLLEAMAMGCACISLDCETGPKEIVDHQINGVLTNRDTFAKDLQSVMSDTALREMLSKRAIEVRDKYSTGMVLQAWDQAIAEIQ